MSGGSIAGCVAANGSGGGICNDGTTKLSGSAKIQDCRASHSGNGGGVFNAPEKNLTVNHVEITGCTIPDAMYFENGTVSGGRFDGEVTKWGGIISGGTFDNRVRNKGGTISDGTFNGKVNNEGNIENGTFSGTVENAAKGKITDGTFTETSTVNNRGTIGGGTFSGTVENKGGTIKNGIFNGAVENQASGTISGGTFSGTVTNNGTINGGTFAVTFDTKGGSTVPVENVLNGQKATSLPTPPGRAIPLVGGTQRKPAPIRMNSLPLCKTH